MTTPITKATVRAALRDGCKPDVEALCVHLLGYRKSGYDVRETTRVQKCLDSYRRQQEAMAPVEVSPR